MLITRETDYALRILRALGDGKQRSIEEISRLEATPKQFAYRIIKKLEKIGWLSITRGVDGGCRLTVDLASVNLLELMEGIGNNIEVNACMQADYLCSRQAVCTEVCNIHKGLCLIQNTLNQELKSHSIRELIEG